MCLPLCVCLCALRIFTFTYVALLFGLMSYNVELQGLDGFNSINNMLFTTVLIMLLVRVLVSVTSTFISTLCICGSSILYERLGGAVATPAPAVCLLAATLTGCCPMFVSQMPYVGISLYTSDKQMFIGDASARRYRTSAYYAAKVRGYCGGVGG